MAVADCISLHACYCCICSTT